MIALSTWLHTLATVVSLGHYLFLSLVYLPVLARQAQGSALRELLEAVSGRLRPFFGGSLLIFLALVVLSERAILARISDPQLQALSQFRLTLGANTRLSLLILLVTTAAQAA